MKRLTLIRHAKSDWNDPSLSDFERPLSGRGQRDAPRMGERLAARGARPSRILSSPALRARQTARIVAECLGYPRDSIRYEPDLYLASADTLLASAAAQDDRYGDIMLVAHNPGLEDLVWRLAPDWPLAKLPTAAVAAIDFDVDSWSAIAAAPARLAFHDYPKNPQPLTPAG